MSNLGCHQGGVAPQSEDCGCKSHHQPPFLTGKMTHLADSGNPLTTGRGTITPSGLKSPPRAVQRGLATGGDKVNSPPTLTRSIRAETASPLRGHRAGTTAGEARKCVGRTFNLYSRSVVLSLEAALIGGGLVARPSLLKGLVDGGSTPPRRLENFSENCACVSQTLVYIPLIVLW